MVGLGEGGEMAVRSRILVAVEPEAVAAEEVFGDLRGLELGGGEFYEALQIEVVVVDGVLGSAALYF